MSVSSDDTRQSLALVDFHFLTLSMAFYKTTSTKVVPYYYLNVHFKATSILLPYHTKNTTHSLAENRACMSVLGNVVFLQHCLQLHQQLLIAWHGTLSFFQVLQNTVHHVSLGCHVRVEH